MKKMKAEEVKIQFNLKACCFYEKLTGKSFFKIGDEDDILHFLYCSCLVNNPTLQMTYKTFLGLMENKKFSHALTTQYQLQSSILAQIKQKENEGEKGDDELTANRIASSLIIQYHMDPHYVMYEMNLWESAEYFKMAEYITKEHLVEQRLWTFLQVAPQIDMKKIKTPQKFLPFAWEEDEEKSKAQAELEKEMERAKATLGMKLNI